MSLKPRELLEFTSEDGFWELVAKEKQGWKAKAPAIQEAIYRNALDADHKDQWLWMQRFERMTGMTFLPGEGSDGLGL